MFGYLQCINRVFNTKKISASSPTQDKFSRQEKYLLRKSWNLIKSDMQEIAVKIFEMIFEKSPQAKKMFPFMKFDRDESEKHSNEFTFHALRFIQVLESAIEALDDLSKLTPLLTNLGRIHTRQQQAHGFDPCYWIIFQDCTLYHFRRAFASSSNIRLICSCRSTISEHEVDSMIALWRELIEYIIQGMKICFFECVKSREERRKIMDAEDGGSINTNELSSTRSNDVAVLSKSTISENGSVHGEINLKTIDSVSKPCDT